MFPEQNPSKLLLLLLGVNLPGLFQSSEWKQRLYMCVPLTAQSICPVFQRAQEGNAH